MRASRLVESDFWDPHALKDSAMRGGLDEDKTHLQSLIKAKAALTRFRRVSHTSEYVFPVCTCARA